MKMLDACYQKVINGIDHVSPSVEKMAQDYLEKQEMRVKQGREDVDREFEQKTQEAAQAADKSYLGQKRALDDAFEQNRTLWIQEITQHILTTE